MRSRRYRARKSRSAILPAGPREGGKFDAVNHDCFFAVVEELVDMPEAPEWSFDLFIDEIVRGDHLGYPAGSMRNIEQRPF